MSQYAKQRPDIAKKAIELWKIVIADSPNSPAAKQGEKLHPSSKSWRKNPRTDHDALKRNANLFADSLSGAYIVWHEYTGTINIASARSGSLDGHRAGHRNGDRLGRLQKPPAFPPTFPSSASLSSPGCSWGSLPCLSAGVRRSRRADSQRQAATMFF